MALKQVLVKLYVSPPNTCEQQVMDVAVGLKQLGFVVDRGYNPVRMPDNHSERISPHDRVFVVRGKIEEARISDLESANRVLGVWPDSPVQPFGAARAILTNLSARGEDLPLAFSLILFPK